MKITICEDEQVYSTALSNCINRWQAQYPNITVCVDVFSSAEDVWDAFNRNHLCDLLIIDIEMPDGLNGFQLAENIRKVNEQVTLTFVTNSQSYALKGYNVDALRYIKKPFYDWQIFEVLDIVARKISLQCGKQIILSLKDQQIVLSFQEIIYIESQEHYLKFYVTKSEKCITVRMRIMDVLKQLNSDLFIQTHRGFIVNVMFIRILPRKYLVLAEGTQIPISQGFQSSVHKSFKNYYLGKEM